MSFMNPVDMVEEDAADLQFPKVKCVGKLKKPGQPIMVRANEKTKYSTAYYDLKHLVKVMKNLKQQQQQQQQVNDDQMSCIEEAVRCNICQEQLIEPYIKCAECPGEFLQCLQCFAKGCETSSHMNNHSYIILKDDIQVFAGANGWTARDERTLLQRLRVQGYGNWDAIAQDLQYRHTPIDCCQHYHEYYFGGIFERLLKLQNADQSYTPEHMPYAVKMRSVDPPRHDDIGSMQFKIMAGYRCARGDFDTPYDVSAESFLTAISTGDDTLMDINCNVMEKKAIDELKYSLVQAYNHRLKERRRRYKVMRDHGLVMVNRTFSWITKYADALQSENHCKRFITLMQLCKPIKFDLLVESMKYFNDLQKSLFRLYELRQNGVRTLLGATLYFKAKKKRLHEQSKRSKRFEHSQSQYDWHKLLPNHSSASSTCLPINGNIDDDDSTTFSQLSFHNFIGSRKKAAPMDIYGLPGFACLTEDERHLCSVERLAPLSYLNYKNLLITENSKLGYIRLADARRLIKIDVNKTRQIYDFLVDQGHINKAH